MSTERYFSVDVESSGPVPGDYSMLSIGACVVGEPDVSFYAELKPINKNSVPEAMAVSGFDMNQLAEHGEPPDTAMSRFCDWVNENSKGADAVFVGFNACFDWQFVNWYLTHFGIQNPFGFGGIDIKSYYMGKRSTTWGETTSRQLPDEYRADMPLTHNALDDAQSQASVFDKMLRD